MNNTPSPETVLRRAFEVMARQMSTNEPGVIESYDPFTCTASVQPSLMVTRQTETGPVVVRQAVVQHAPVIFLGGGNGRLTFPVGRGDECLLTVASKSLDRWSAFGGEVDPKSDRRHHITDAFVWVTPHLSPAHASPAHATATVLEGDDIRFGTQSATEAALKGDAFLSQLSTLVHAIATAVSTSGTPAGATAAAAAIVTALTTFETAATMYKSTRVKIG